MRAKRRRGPLLLAVAGGVAVALVGAWLLTRTPPRPSAQVTQPIINGPLLLPTPGTAKPTGFRVVVDELHISLPVVEGDGVTAPLYEAAHYPGMKLPGEGDRSVLYAHAQDGMFGNLLLHGAVGDHVEVYRPSQPVLRYVVRQYSKAWSPRDLSILKPVGHEELVLLTCTSYDPNGPRVVAIAEPA